MKMKNLQIPAQRSVSAPLYDARGDVSNSAIVAKLLEMRGLAVDPDADFQTLTQSFAKNGLGLNDMEAAIDRVIQAIRRNEKICILGDYDADGITSTAMMYRFLLSISNLAGNINYHIPHRINDGYGPSIEIVEHAHSNDTDLLIILDSGTTAFGPIERAVALDIDVIIIDHHMPEDVLPKAIVVNPHRNDDNTDLQYLSAAGLVFIFLCALEEQITEKKLHAKSPDLTDYIGLAALGTYADMMPTIDLNRVILRHGLPRLKQNVGMSVLMEALNIDCSNRLDFDDLSFKIAPCINAAGRIDSPIKPLKLLINDDHQLLTDLADELVSINNDRKAMTKQIIKEAQDFLLGKDDDDVIILSSNDWHPGVLGPVASQLQQRYSKPIILIGTEGKGSARSNQEFDIGSALIAARHLNFLASGGGHAAAGGLTLKHGKFQLFDTYVNAEYAKRTHHITPHLTGELQPDIELNCGQLTTVLLSQLDDQVAPYGHQNKKVQFLFRECVVYSVIVKAERHLQVMLHTKKALETRTQEVFLFDGVDNELGMFFQEHQGQMIDGIFQARLNRFGNKTTVQLHPLHLQVSKT